MPELNFDKVYASLDLRIKDIVNIDEFDELTKEFLGKNSLISEERKKLSSLSKEDKKNYGMKLTEATEFITSRIKEQRKLYLNSQFTNKEEAEVTDISIDWKPIRGSYKHVLSTVMEEVVSIFSSIGYEVAYGP